MIKLPYQNPQTGIPTWTQPNVSTKTGSIYTSFNLDLIEDEGNVRVGKRLLLNINTTDDATLTSYPAGFAYFGSKFWGVAGASGTGYVFSASHIDSSFAHVTSGSAPATCDSTISDIIVSNSILYVSTASATVYYTADGTTWSTLSSGTSDSAFTHMMCSFAGRTYMTKLESQIISWDASNTVASPGDIATLQLGNSDSNVITFIRAASNKIWIGTVNKLGGKGYVYSWDGASLQTTSTYKLESAGALSCVIKDDVPYIIDANGKLFWWNGGTFKPLQQVFRRKSKVLYNAYSGVNNRFIHPNGMSIIRNKINILINGSNYDAAAPNATQEETIPSGIYEYDEQKGLSHKYSFGLTKSGGTISDYGQTRILGVGGLAEILTASAPITTNGSFLAGASYYTDATTTTSGIFYDDLNDTLQKGFYLVTPKIYSPSITDTFQSIYYRFKKLTNAADKIVVKYRTVAADFVEASITWTSTTTFTTTTDVSSYWTSGTGGEVEVVQGVGAGRCSHITSIVNNAGTYTVTVDETYTGASTQTAKARFQSWIKLGKTTDTTSFFNNLQFPLSGTATWVQIKIWGLFTGRQEIEDLTIQNNVSQSADNKAKKQ